MTPFRTRLRSSALLTPLVGLAVFGVFVTSVQSRGGGAPFSFVLVAAALFTGLRLVTWLSSRAELEPTGRLVVTGPWPGRRHGVDLATLRRASAGQQVTGTGGRNSRMRVHDTLDLLDDSGATLSLRVREWARADLLIAAVEQAAAQRGVQVTGGELFGMQTATATPPPTAAALPPQGGPVLVLDLRLHNRVVYGFIGAVFTFLGGTTLLFVGGLALLRRAAPLEGLVSGFALLPFLIAPVFGCIGVALLSLALGARLRLGADGVLRVRTNPPWRIRRVALGELTAATASHAGYISVNGRPARPKVALRLADRSGRTLTVDPGAWDNPEAIGPRRLHRRRRRRGRPRPRHRPLPRPRRPTHPERLPPHPARVSTPCTASGAAADQQRAGRHLDEVLTRLPAVGLSSACRGRMTSVVAEAPALPTCLPPQLVRPADLADRRAWRALCGCAGWP